MAKKLSEQELEEARNFIGGSHGCSYCHGRGYILYGSDDKVQCNMCSGSGCNVDTLQAKATIAAIFLNHIAAQDAEIAEKVNALDALKSEHVEVDAWTPPFAWNGDEDEWSLTDSNGKNLDNEEVRCLLNSLSQSYATQKGLADSYHDCAIKVEDANATLTARLAQMQKVVEAGNNADKILGLVNELANGTEEGYWVRRDIVRTWFDKLIAALAECKEEK